jgi:hypothetical protein
MPSAGYLMPIPIPGAWCRVKMISLRAKDDERPAGAARRAGDMGLRRDERYGLTLTFM